MCTLEDKANKMKVLPVWIIYYNYDR
jgi:hypothetical protein